MAIDWDTFPERVDLLCDTLHDPDAEPRARLDAAIEILDLAVELAPLLEAGD